MSEIKIGDRVRYRVNHMGKICDTCFYDGTVVHTLEDKGGLLEKKLCIKFADMNHHHWLLAKECKKLVKKKKKQPENCQCPGSIFVYRADKPQICSMCSKCKPEEKKEPKFEIGDRVEVISNKYFVTKRGMVGVVVSPLHYDDAHKVVRVAFGNDGCGYPIRKSDLKKIEEPKFKVGDWVAYILFGKIVKAKICPYLVFGDMYLLSNGVTIRGEELTKCDPPELKLEVGKFYKTRDGRKAFCHYIDNEHDSAWLVIVDSSILPTVTINGKPKFSAIMNTAEIIEEWRD